jgi:hypothetical protein
MRLYLAIITIYFVESIIKIIRIIVVIAIIVISYQIEEERQRGRESGKTEEKIRDGEGGREAEERQ